MRINGSDAQWKWETWNPNSVTWLHLWNPAEMGVNPKAWRAKASSSSWQLPVSKGTSDSGNEWRKYLTLWDPWRNFPLPPFAVAGAGDSTHPSSPIHIDNPVHGPYHQVSFIPNTHSVPKPRYINPNSFHLTSCVSDLQPSSRSRWQPSFTRHHHRWTLPSPRPLK